MTSQWCVFRKAYSQLRLQLFSVYRKKIYITSWETDEEKVEMVTDFIFLGSKITADHDYSHKIKRQFAPWKKSYDKPTQSIKDQRHHFVNKGLDSQSYGFSSSHIWM